MTSFTSASLGQINPPINILKEFLATFNRRQKCKAAILSWLDGKHYYGNSWVRITFENLANILGYCRETISKHMRELVFDGLVEDKPSHRFPKDTASEYRLNLENIMKIIEFCQCEKNNTNVPDIPHKCANNPTIYETSSKFSENNNIVGVEEENEALEWEKIADEAEKLEKAQISHFVDEQEEVNLNEDEAKSEDKSSVGQVEVVMTLNNQSSVKPSKSEIKEVCNQLKRLRINPDPCLGVIKKYWSNVTTAITRVKEAIKEDWCDNPTGLFIASCKNGEKAKNTVTTQVSDWFEWARRERIVIAMSGGFVYTPEGEAVQLEEMMQQCPMKK